MLILVFDLVVYTNAMAVCSHALLLVSAAQSHSDHYFPGTPIALFNAFYLAVPEALFLANAIVYANKASGNTAGFTSAEFGGESSGVSRSRNETESVRVTRINRTTNVRPPFSRAGSSNAVTGSASIGDVALVPASADATGSMSDSLVLLPGDGFERSNA